MKYLFNVAIAVSITAACACTRSWSDKTLAEMTLEQKIGQMICTDISGTYDSFRDSLVQKWATLASGNQIGGFVVYGGTPAKLGELLNFLQEKSKIPLLISADFEGGPGQQVKGASEFPGHMAFAAAGDDELMYRAARAMAEEGRLMGIHLTYSPVTDISTDPDNPQESVRSLGGNQTLINKLLKAYVRGFHDEGMLTTAKHFPGRGNQKPAKEIPGFNYLDGSAETFNQGELKAFRSAVEAGVDFIMTEHIAVPSVTGGSWLPASVEPKLATDVIRNQLGFKGILTTDDLWYDHVINRFGAEEVAVLALLAGHDIILKPKSPEKTIQAIAKAVMDGRLSEARIDQSVIKILRIKEQLGLHQNRMVNADQIKNLVGSPDHLALVREVADRSVTLLRNDNILPLADWDPASCLHLIVTKEAGNAPTNELEKKALEAFPGLRQVRLETTLGEPARSVILKEARQADYVFVSFLVQRTRFGSSAPLRSGDKELLTKIISEKPGQVVAFSFGNPHIISELPGIPCFAVGYGENGWYGNQPVYFESWIRFLKGELKPQGRLPVKVGKRYPIGSGLSLDRMTDPRDGRTYSTVRLGNQIWMAENLAWLPAVYPWADSQFDSSRFYVYGYQGYDPADATRSNYYREYGVLYNYPAALEACPEGWHLPTDAEWTDLAKMGLNPGWNPGGCRGYGGFESEGFCGYYWSASPMGMDNAWRRGFCHDAESAFRVDDRRYFGCSVRCVKNN